MGGYTQTDSELTFTGLTTKATTKHKRTNTDAELTIIDNYTYDDQLRLTKHTQKTGSKPVQLITENVYDALGTLVTKNVGGLETVSNPLQKVDYKYNVRGWLTDINSVPEGVSKVIRPNALDQKDLFNFKINYNKTFGGDNSTQKQYNGNISSVAWLTKTDNEGRGYAYDYDHLNRLNYGSHLNRLEIRIGGLLFGYNYTRTGQYAEDVSYDKNGNILTLDRYGQEVSGQPIQLDELNYAYDGNRLLKVADGTNNPDGFKDGTNTGNDFTYDTMGNLMTDQNKGIGRIKYNHLNLPVEVALAGGTVKYTYDAAGTRLSKKVVSTADGTVITDYLGGFQYENNDLQFFFQPEGYVKKENNSYLYVFQYKDHLGNNRLTYADIDGNGEISPASEILEENNYYPFGLKHQGYNELATDAHQYKFLDKEYQSELGLNTIATDYRHYDPAIGRFNVMDAMSEAAYGQTPYRYGFNNPINWTDPTGLFESELAAKAFAIEELGLSDGQYRIDPYTDGGYVILVTEGEFKGTVFYEYGELLPDLDIDRRSGGGGGGKGNSTGKTYIPSFGELLAVNSINTTPGGLMVSGTNIMMSAFTGQMRHLYGPDAIVLTKDVTGGAVVGGTIGWGIILFTRGEHEGKAYLLGDYGVGVSTVDISTGFSAQGLYYSGSISYLSPKELQGERFSASLGLKEFGYLGGNISYSSTEKGFKVFGVGGSIGFASPSLISVNLNWGNTIIISQD